MLGSIPDLVRLSVRPMVDVVTCCSNDDKGRGSETGVEHLAAVLAEGG
jgi:hypothetical protein